MNKKELDTLLSNNTLPKSLMLYGESDFMLSHYVQAVLAKLGSSDEIRRVFYDEFSYKDAKSFLSQMSLFGGNNIYYLKTDKGISKAEVDNLVAICHNSHESYFVFDFRGEAKRAKELSGSFSKKNSANFVRFFKPNFSESIAFLSMQAKKLSLSIDSYALTHLYHSQGEELALAYNELEKLKILDKHITAKEIDVMVYGLHSIDIGSFIKLLLSKKDIKQALFKLQESGSVSEVDIINAIQNHFVTLFLFFSYIRSYGPPDAKAILGYVPPKFVQDEWAHSSKRFKLNHYNRVLSHLAFVESALKLQTNIDKSSFLLSSLIKLQTFL
jgi:DNA polymerase-3 subunit delta